MSQHTLTCTASPTGSPIRRQLGRTGLNVSRLGLGLAALGRPAYMALGRHDDFGSDRSIALMQRRCHALLDEAYAAGVTYLDVARSYGLAEQFLQNWCTDQRLPDDAVTIGSKWGYTYVGGWSLDAPIHEVKQLSASVLRRQTAESRTILGSRLSLYQIHSATVESHVLDDRQVLTELARLRERGLAIGITVTGPRQRDVIRAALDVRVDGVELFQTVQATWNLLEPSARPALEEARAAGLGVIVKETLANGRLTNRYAGAEVGDLRRYAAARGTSIETVAIATALAQPWADVVLSGAATCEQLREHIAAVDMSFAFPSDAVAEPPPQYWHQRSTLRWR